MSIIFYANDLRIRVVNIRLELVGAPSITQTPKEELTKEEKLERE